MPPADDPHEPSIERFLGEEPTQELVEWRALWEADRAFPLRSHRGFFGRLGEGQGARRVFSQEIQFRMHGSHSSIFLSVFEVSVTPI